MNLHLQPEIPLQHIRAITLDLDDTLWAISPVIRNAEARLRAWLDAHYPQITEQFSSEDMLTVWQRVSDEFPHKSHDLGFIRKKVIEYVALAAGHDPALAEPAFRIFLEARNTVELYPDVIPHLERLHGRFTLVAVTNGNADLQAIGIRHLFHDVVTAAGAGVAKPERQIFDMAVGKTGVAASEVLHVGDHPETDIDGARRAGLSTAWINRNGVAWPDHLDDPDATVTSMAELWQLLDRAAAGDG
jgi:putative hydrolase of the HAD superfamily